MAPSCAVCGGDAPFHCAGCRGVSYCGEACQEVHFAAHAPRCGGGTASAAEPASWREDEDEEVGAAAMRLGAPVEFTSWDEVEEVPGGGVACVFDVDGTLTPYPGSNRKSLYFRYEAVMNSHAIGLYHDLGRDGMIARLAGEFSRSGSIGWGITDPEAAARAVVEAIDPPLPPPGERRAVPRISPWTPGGAYLLSDDPLDWAQDGIRLYVDQHTTPDERRAMRIALERARALSGRPLSVVTRSWKRCVEYYLEAVGVDNLFNLGIDRTRTDRGETALGSIFRTAGRGGTKGTSGAGKEELMLTKLPGIEEGGTLYYEAGYAPESLARQANIIGVRRVVFVDDDVNVAFDLQRLLDAKPDSYDDHVQIDVVVLGNAPAFGGNRVAWLGTDALAGWAAAEEVITGRYVRDVSIFAAPRPLPPPDEPADDPPPRAAVLGPVTDREGSGPQDGWSSDDE